MKKWVLGISISLLLTTRFAYAQVGPCPPGMSQYSSPNGIPSCGPLRSDYDQPQGHWQDQWGSLAISSDGTTGWAFSQSSERIAQESAIENCISKGGTQCEVNLTYQNACIAVVNGDNGGYASSDATNQKAIKRAMKSCKKAGQKHCELLRTECSPVKWIGD